MERAHPTTTGRETTHPSSWAVLVSISVSVAAIYHESIVELIRRERTQEHVGLSVGRRGVRVDNMLEQHVASRCPADCRLDIDSHRVTKAW